MYRNPLSGDVVLEALDLYPMFRYELHKNLYIITQYGPSENGVDRKYYNAETGIEVRQSFFTRPGIYSYFSENVVIGGKDHGIYDPNHELWSLYGGHGSNVAQRNYRFLKPIVDKQRADESHPGAEKYVEFLKEHKLQPPNKFYMRFAPIVLTEHLKYIKGLEDCMIAEFKPQFNTITDNERAPAPIKDWRF